MIMAVLLKHMEGKCMKEFFEPAQVEFILIQTSDIITVSNNGENGLDWSDDFLL